MVDTLFSVRLEPVEERYRAKTSRIVLYTLLNTNNLSGILYFAAGFTTAMRIFGQQLQYILREGVRWIADFFSNSLSPALAVLAAILLLFWAGIFLAHLFYLLQFRCRRSQNILRLSCGLVSQHHTHMMVSRINSVTLVESNLSRLIGMGYATLRCSGYGKRDGTNNLLVPSCSMKELRQENLHPPSGMEGNGKPADPSSLYLAVSWVPRHLDGGGHGAGLDSRTVGGGHRRHPLDGVGAVLAAYELAVLAAVARLPPCRDWGERRLGHHPHHEGVPPHHHPGSPGPALSWHSFGKAPSRSGRGSAI